MESFYTHSVQRVQKSENFHFHRDLSLIRNKICLWPTTIVVGFRFLVKMESTYVNLAHMALVMVNSILRMIWLLILRARFLSPIMEITEFKSFVPIMDDSFTSLARTARKIGRAHV